MQRRENDRIEEEEEEEEEQEEEEEEEESFIQPFKYLRDVENDHNIK